MYLDKRLLYILAFADIQKIHVDVDMTTKQLIWEVEQVTERLTVQAPSGLIHLVDDSESGVNQAIKKLYEYEAAEEEGRLVVLPCKVGDTVYVLRQSWNGWNIDKEKFTYRMIGKLGKTVFLARGEAEKALQEMEGK